MEVQDPTGEQHDEALDDGNESPTRPDPSRGSGDSTDDDEEDVRTERETEEVEAETRNGNVEKQAEDMELDDDDDVVRKPRRARRQALSDSDEEEEVQKKEQQSRERALVDSADEDAAADVGDAKTSTAQFRGADSSDGEASGKRDDEDMGDQRASPRREQSKQQRRRRLARASDDGDSEDDTPASKVDDEEEKEEEAADVPLKSKKEQMRELAELAKTRKQAESREEEEEGDVEEPPRSGLKRKSRKDSRREADAERERANEKKRKRREKEKKRLEKKKARTEKNRKRDGKKKAAAAAPALTAEDLITQQLEKIISTAVDTGDTNLTLRVCREQIAARFGEDVTSERKKFIKEEVGRILGECQAMSAEEVGEMAASCKAVTDAEIHALHNPEEAEPNASSSSASASEGEESEESEGSEESDGSVPAGARRGSAKKGRRARESDLFDGIVVVPAGDLQGDKAAVERLRSLIEAHGGKVQSAVTSKVKFVVIAKSQGRISHRDPRVKSAQKHGARIVLEHLFTESVEAKAVQSPADYMAGIGEAAGGRGRGRDDDDDDNEGRKKKKKSARKARAEGEEEMEGMEEDDEDGGSKPRSRRRVQARRAVEEDDWTKEFRARFGYRQDAKSRPFSAKDPVVPDATFYQDGSGVVYNAYLTQTDAVEEEANHTKFYSFKLVEAGGMMKGEKWHLVTQWGKVGAQKPGCDVGDFSDLKEARAAFHQKFWEKTRNSWEAGPFSFRTVSGKYSLVELSDEEEEEVSDSELAAGETELDASVQRVVKALMGRATLREAVAALQVDDHRMPLRKLKRYRVNEALAELSAIQALILKGEKKSSKDEQKAAAHAERIRNILPTTKSSPIESVAALKERAAMLEDLGEVCVANALRKRAIAAPAAGAGAGVGGEGGGGSQLGALYNALRSQLSQIPESGETFSSIRMMLAGTAVPDPASSFQLRLDRVFAVHRAGDDLRFAPFKRLPNRMMLWRGGRPSSIASALGQGIRVPLQETPSAGYLFGKGIYLHDCVSEAVARCHLQDSDGEGWLLLCEAALGNIKESTKPSALRRAPHGFHSVLGKGKRAYNPAETVQLGTIPEGSEQVTAVVGPPVAAHGAAESVAAYNQYVLFDVSQLRPRYLVQVSLQFRET